MKLKLESQELIDFFETDVITEDVLDEFNGYQDKTICINADFSNFLGYQVFNEIRRISMYFPNLKNIGVFCFVKSGEDVKKVLECLPTVKTDFIGIKGNLKGADFSLISYFKNLTELKIIQSGVDKKINLPAIELPKKTEFVTLKNIKLPTQINTQEFQKQEKKVISLMLNDVSQLTLKQLDELEKRYKINKIGIVRYPEENGEGTIVDSFYSAGEYRIIVEKLEELIRDIDINLPDGKKIVEIYRRVAEDIEYDNYSAGQKRVPLEARNLKNTLIYGEGVCVGYANVLKEACSLLGMEAVMVHGIIGKSKEHTWNKIKIDGEWYNFDATYDHEYIINGDKPRYMFRTDNFLKHDYLEERRKEISGPKCSKKYKENKSVLTRIKEIFWLFTNKKTALPEVNEQKRSSINEKKSWVLEEYGTSKKEYRNRALNILEEQENKVETEKHLRYREK